MLTEAKLVETLMSKESIIVAGFIETQPGRRDLALSKSLEVISQARRTAGCSAFVVAADPLEVDRLVTFEIWDSAKALADFRGGGPDDDQAADFKAIHVHDYIAARKDA